MDLLKGYRGVVVGVANERSLAYSIAQAAQQAGAQVVLTYQNERVHSRVAALATQLGATAVLPCELTVDEQIDALASAVAARWDAIDFLVHSVAFAPRAELEGSFLRTSRAGFATAMDISVYSLVALTRALQPLLQRSTHAPSVLTLTYYGSEKAVPNYNVMGVAKAGLEAAVRYLARDLGPMGIRVNALSAGPVKTLSAAAVKGLRTILDQVETHAPLRRNISGDDVGRAALFALSDLASGMTGEVFHVDAGYHAVVAVDPAPQGLDANAPRTPPTRTPEIVAG